MGEFDGRVVMITGGARGQGRSHALAFASQGADVVVADIAAPIATVPYELGTEADLKETKSMVEQLGRRCVSVVADCRDTNQMNEAVGRGIAELGKIDILLANAGVMSLGPIETMDDATWNANIDVCLTGVFKACRAVLPHMRERGYGRIINTASVAGKAGLPNIVHYVAAKSGVMGFTRALAVEVAPLGITVNAVAPTACNTDMIHNDANYILFSGWSGGDAPAGPLELTDEIKAGFQSMHAIPIPWIEAEDVTNAMLFLASEKARYITGAILNVSAGAFFAA